MGQPVPTSLMVVIAALAVFKLYHSGELNFLWGAGNVPPSGAASAAGGDLLWASAADTYTRPLQTSLACNGTDQARNPVEGCTPVSCGRMVLDGIITSDEAGRLRALADAGMSLGDSVSKETKGPAQIMDLHSGAVTMGSKFSDVYKLNAQAHKYNAQDGIDETLPTLKVADVELYVDVTRRVQKAVESAFSCQKTHLTAPTFFSRMNGGVKPRTVHDEYWHLHSDRDTYPAFDYTALVYLNTAGKDYSGGKFSFLDQGVRTSIEPREGRLATFTSGDENWHHVHRVDKGTRYALTISFTCTPSKGLKNFLVDRVRALKKLGA